MHAFRSEHPPDGIFDPDSTHLPKVPGVMTIDMFISQKEENLLKVAAPVTLENRETYTLPGSDAIEEIKEDVKREQALTVSVVEPTGKRTAVDCYLLDKISVTLVTRGCSCDNSHGDHGYG